MPTQTQSTKSRLAQRLETMLKEHRKQYPIHPKPRKPNEPTTLLGHLWHFAKAWAKLHPGQTLFFAWLLFKKGKSWLKWSLAKASFKACKVSAIG